MKNQQGKGRIIAGTMGWGQWGKSLDEKQLIELMNYCLEIGIDIFDHADIYGDYENESLFGNAFEKSGINRGQIKLISKCGIQMTRGRSNRVKHYQYDKDYIVWSVERSLKSLKTDYLDLLLLHRPSPLMDPSEIGAAFEKLSKQGKVRSFGVSNFTPSQISLLETEVQIEANQVQFSLTHTEPMYDGAFDDCLVNNRMAMSWAPLGNFFKDPSSINPGLSKTIEELSGKYNADASQLLLAFIMKHPCGVKPVVGTTNANRLKAAKEAEQLDLELEDWFLMLESATGHRVP